MPVRIPFQYHQTVTQHLSCLEPDSPPRVGYLQNRSLPFFALQEVESAYQNDTGNLICILYWSTFHFRSSSKSGCSLQDDDPLQDQDVKADVTVSISNLFHVLCVLTRNAGLHENYSNTYSNGHSHHFNPKSWLHYDVVNAKPNWLAKTITSAGATNHSRHRFIFTSSVVCTYHSKHNEYLFCHNIY